MTLVASLIRNCRTIYVSNKDEIMRRLAQPEAGWELATEFMQRHRLGERQQLVPRPLRHLSPQIRAAVVSAAVRQQYGITHGEGQKI